MSIFKALFGASNFDETETESDRPQGTNNSDQSKVNSKDKPKK
jgi:hypothetical protein